MKKRVISAVIMLAIVVPLLIIGGLPFKLFAVVLSIVAMHEITSIRKNKEKLPIFLQVLSYLFVGLIVFMSSEYDIDYNIDYKMFTLLFGTFLLPIVFINDNKRYNITDALYLIGIILFLGVSFNTFVLVRNVSLYHLLYLALITVFTDMFAMFGGSLIGKHKLCEKISPKKTIEGSIVGSVVGTMVATIFYMLIINPNANFILVCLVTLLFSVVGQLGDLFFSSIKRNFDVKDFSNLIPGHGGILDRLDSLLFVMITYMLFINIL